MAGAGHFLCVASNQVAAQLLPCKVRIVAKGTLVTATTRVAGRAHVTLGVAVLVVVMTAAASGASSPAGTQRPDRPRPPGTARFEGATIDLAHEWGDAQACVVWDDTDTECFRTSQQADRAVRRREQTELRGVALRTTISTQLAATRSLRLPTAPAPGTPSPQLASTCSDWLTLYQYAYFGGRSLRFRDRGYYQDLATWGFASTTSSFVTTNCGVTFRDAAWYLYPGNTAPNTFQTTMAFGWDNRVRYLRIN